jgi:hypothetical protein
MGTPATNPAPIQRPQLLRGKARMRQLAAEADAERKAIAAKILADLGRPASMLDEIAARNLAALDVRASRLEANGKDATAVRQQITQAQRASGFRPAKPAEAKPPSIQELLAARGFKPPVAPPTTPAPEQRADATRASEAANAHGKVSP